jgi:hypothetical protein
VPIIISTSCKALQQSTGATADRLYEINPSGSAPIQAFCEMSTGGWTLIFDAASADSSKSYLEQFGLNNEGTESLSTSLNFASSYATFGATSGGGWPTYAEMVVPHISFSAARLSVSFYDAGNHLCASSIHTVSPQQHIFSFGDCWAGSDCTHASYRTVRREPIKPGLPPFFACSSTAHSVPLLFAQSPTGDTESLCRYNQGGTCAGNTFSVSMSFAEATGLHFKGGKYAGYVRTFANRTCASRARLCVFCSVLRCCVQCADV